MSRCTSRATLRRAARSSSVSSLTSCAATWSVARRPNWRNASRTRSRSPSAPCSRNSSCARANQVAADADGLPFELALGVADEVAVGEVGLGELARQVVGGDELDGARERRFGGAEVAALVAERADDEQRRGLDRGSARALRQIEGALDQRLGAVEIAGGDGQLGEAGVDGRERAPVGVRLEVAAGALERARRAGRFAAATVDFAEVHQRARLGLEIAAAARRFEVALEVRLGAIVLAATEERNAGHEVDALAQLRLGGDAARTAQMHERLTVVALGDQDLGDFRFHFRAWVARRKLFELLAQSVQFLNFRAQAAQLYRKAAAGKMIRVWERMTPVCLTHRGFGMTLRVE